MEVLARIQKVLSNRITFEEYSNHPIIQELWGNGVYVEPGRAPEILEDYPLWKILLPASLDKLPEEITQGIDINRIPLAYHNVSQGINELFTDCARLFAEKDTLISHTLTQKLYFPSEVSLWESITRSAEERSKDILGYHVSREEIFFRGIKDYFAYTDELIENEEGLEPVLGPIFRPHLEEKYGESINEWASTLELILFDSTVNMLKESPVEVETIEKRHTLNTQMNQSLKMAFSSPTTGEIHGVDNFKRIVDLLTMITTAVNGRFIYYQMMYEMPLKEVVEAVGIGAMVILLRRILVRGTEEIKRHEIVHALSYYYDTSPNNSEERPDFIFVKSGIKRYIYFPKHD